ncbi:MAG: hypothetical protein HYX79_00935 [Chloroflexi bacterium]|nr:hypothetical protein [Chloroflexota bacterium]
MPRLIYSEALQRKIRVDEVPELEIPSFTLANEAMRAGRLDEASEFIEYGCGEDTRTHDSLVMVVDAFCRSLAEFGEEEVEKAFRQRYSRLAANFLSGNPSVELLLRRGAEFQRAHHGSFKITEESDRYVVTCDPCGSGGRLRRTVKNVGVTKKAYPWSWGKTGVPYYCSHCSIMMEIAPIEIRGYPIRITLLGDRPEDPCVHYYYKRPELIPEEYFTRVGKTKTIK